MSIEKEFEGETVTDAAIEACKELGISRDELEFDVIQEESSGVLGIGSRKAIIRVISKDEKYENKTDNSIDSPEDNLNIDKQLRVGMSVSVTIDTKYESEIPIIIRPFASIFKSLRD